MFYRLGIKGLSFFIILIFPSFALAENTPEQPYVMSPIVVTANKREQSVQEVPASISVVDSKQIEDFRIEKVQDVFKATPNIYLLKTGPSASGTTFASMRGIASTMGGSPVLGLYVDDIYYPNLDITLLDVERVEVLRGPQGTLYGRNTEAGVINIVTKQPTNQWEGKVGAEYGSYNTRNFKGVVSGPLIEDALLFRASGSYRASDSYFKNKYDGDDSVNKYEDKDFRFRLTTSPDEKFRMALTFDLQDYWAGGYADFAPMSSVNPRKNINTDYAGSAWKEGHGASLRAEYDFSGATLLSVTSFRKETLTNKNDIDFLPVDLYRLKVDYDTTSYNQELRLSSNNKSSPLQWLVGAYGFYEEADKKTNTRMNFANMGMPFLGVQNAKTQGDTSSTGMALFSQGSYTIWDRLELTAGLRYDHLYRSMDYSSSSGALGAMMGNPDIKGSRSKTFEAWLPKFALSYKLTDNIRPYASVSRGYREGGFNFIEKVGQAYKSEYTWNYELGTKTGWFDDKLLFNLAFFYIDWKDRQVEVLAAGGDTWHIDNAGKAVSKGVEAELIARPFMGLEVMGSFGYTNAEYKDYSPAPGVDYSGRKVVDSPQYTARLGATYRFDNGIFLGATYNRYGKVYYSLDNDTAQSSYDIVDLKVGYEGDGFEVYAWGNNIFNEKYFTRGSQGAGHGTWYGRPGEPQMFGVSASLSF